VSAASIRIREWRENPVKFAWDVFHFEPDAWQREALEAAGRPGRKRLGFKACAGPGKTAVLAILGWHRLLCFARKGEHPKGAAVSITGDNLKDNLWPELSKWQQRSELLKTAFTWTKERVFANDHAETWFLSARTYPRTADPETLGRTLSGLHSEFPFYLIDESGDMSPQIAKSAEQGLSNCVDGLIATAGNTTSQSGLLYDVCIHKRNLWYVITITADPDDPNRTPRVDADWAREQIQLYGRENPWVMAYILGLFPPGGINQLLSVEEVEAAMQRTLKAHEYDFASLILGVDVARQGDDRSVIFPRQGLKASAPMILRNQPTEMICGQTAKMQDELRADALMVDGTGGYGAGVVDGLRALKRKPMEVQFASKPMDPRYANKRAEMWFEMAEWVKRGGALPNLPELVGELAVPTYSFQGDRMILEPKEKIKARLGRSPDLADALACTFAFPVGPRSNRRKPDDEPEFPFMGSGNQSQSWMG
jgi:hypothetical protein